MIMLTTYSCKDDDIVANPPKVTEVKLIAECTIDSPAVCTYVYEVTFDQDLPENSTANFTSITSNNCDSSSLGAIPILNQLEAQTLSSGEVPGGTDPESCTFVVSFILNRPNEEAIRFEDKTMIIE